MTLVCALKLNAKLNFKVYSIETFIVSYEKREFSPKVQRIWKEGQSWIMYSVCYLTMADVAPKSFNFQDITICLSSVPNINVFISGRSNIFTYNADRVTIKTD